jgi:hypothetical protein
MSNVLGNRRVFRLCRGSSPDRPRVLRRFAVAPMALAAFFEKHPLELPEIAISEKPADHVCRDLRGPIGSS